MRITVGVKSVKEAEYCLSHGADEIYFGPPMPNFHGSFSKGKDIVEAVKLAKSCGKKTVLALNEMYSRELYGYLLGQARRLTEKGVDGITVRDPALLEYFRSKGFSTYFILSSNSACFNSQAMKFFRDLGARRYIFHNQTLPEQAAKMMKMPGIETEIFVPFFFLEPCLTPFCFFRCCASEQACKYKFRSGRHDFRMVESNLYFQARVLYDFWKLGVDWLKVTRQENGLKVMTELNIAVALRRFLETGVDRKTFMVKAAEVIQAIDLNKYGPTWKST